MGYGHVLDAKVLVSDGKQSVRGLVRMANVEEAKRVKELLDGKVPAGLKKPIGVRFAGDGYSTSQRALQKMNAGEEIYVGQIRTFIAEKNSGFIACEDMYNQQGTEVYAYRAVLESCGAGPGDTVAFFVHWK